MDDVRLSQFLSLVLRHKPQKIGLTLDEEGWADVEELLAAMARDGKVINRARLERVVANNDKQRYGFDETGTKIRARQGHSLKVDLKFTAVAAPLVLWHGTVERFLRPILAEGLKPGRRQHVHLSADTETARAVGARRGKPVVLKIDAAAMQAVGHDFFLSDNGVWLTAAVPPEFLSQE